MALQKQLLPLAYGGGLDTKTDQASVPLGKWLVLENAIFTKPGSIHKRNGYSSLAASILGGGSVAAGSALTTRLNELILADASTLYSYDQANTSWVNKGSLPSASMTALAQINNKDSLTQYDTALHSGGLQIFVSAQVTSGGAFADLIYAVVDTATGQLVVPPTQLDTASNQPQCPKVCVLGGFFFVAWQRNNAGLYSAVAQAIAVSAPQTLVYGSPQAVTSGVGTSALVASPGWDMTVSNGEIYIVFANRSGTTTIFGITAVSTYTQPHSAVVAGTAPALLCICGNPFNNDVVVGMIPTARLTIVAFAYNSTLSTQTLAPTVLDTQVNGFISVTAVGASAVATSIQIFGGWTTGANFDDASFIRKTSLGAAYAAGAVSTIGRQLKIAGKAALRSGSVYLPAWITGVPGPGGGGMPVDESLQNTWLLIDSSGSVIAKAFPNNGAGLHQFGNSATDAKALLETPVNASGQIGSLVGVVTYLAFGSSGLPSTQTIAVNLVQVSFADTVNQFTKAALGALTLFSGAIPRIYDGARVVEQGFHTFPEITSITHAAGGNLSAGTYQYVAVYEWQDATGQTHRSAPSPAVSVTALLNEKATVTVSTLRLTQKTNVLVSLFRTIAGGTIFFQVTNMSVNFQLLNDTTNATVTYVDGLSDTLTSAQRQLYTTGGALQSAAPPPLNSVIVHGSRVFGIDPTTGQLAYTKQYIPGSTGQPIEFSGFLTMNVDNRGGNSAALASLDEKLIIFKSDRIFFVTGDGPDATGANDNFSKAVLLSSDTGCAAPKSVVLVPDGIMFKSPKGFYLLDRALRVSYIGAPVESYNSANVTSANLIPSTNQVRFTLDSGVALVYDYRADQWGTFTNISATDATIWQGNFVYLTSAGITNQETPGVFSDPGSTFIAMKAVSPWIQLAQVQGFQRVYKVLVLGQYVSAHKLRVKLAYDFATSFAQTDDITVSSNPAPYQYRVHCAKQKCEALQISVEDISTGTIGEALSLSGLTLEAGIKRGLFRMPASKSFG